MTIDNPTAEDLSVLRAVRELFSDPTHWQQGNFASDTEGNVVHPSDASAVSWCLLGAVTKVGGNRMAFRNLVMPFIDHSDGEYYDTLVDWNDLPDRTHTQVLEMLDRAIAKVEQS